MATAIGTTALANPTVTFKINDTMLGGATDTWCTVTQVGGKLVFRIEDRLGGDITGLFFDWADKLEGILKNLQITDGTAPLGALQVGNDSIVKLAGGVTMEGLVSKTDAFDAGMTVGLSGGASAGGVADHYSSVSFTMSTKDGTALDLSLLSGLTIGVREQSLANGDSAKIMETIDAIVTAKDDAIRLTEDTVSTTNVFANDVLTSATKAEITTWGIVLKDGSTRTFAIGTAVDIGFGVTATMHADGRLVIDANGADAMAKGEIANFSFFYTAQYVSGDMTSTSSAKIGVTIDGANDAPVITQDISLTADGAAASDNVLNYSTDIDRGAILAGHSLAGALIDAATGEARYDIADSGGSYLTLNADGTVTAVAGDRLEKGTTLTGSVKVAVTDEHGATAEANIAYTLVGHYNPNRPPDAVDDSVRTTIEGLASGQIVDWLANDSDPDAGDSISFAGVNGQRFTLQDLAALPGTPGEVSYAPTLAEQYAGLFGRIFDRLLTIRLSEEDRAAVEAHQAYAMPALAELNARTAERAGGYDALKELTLAEEQPLFFQVGSEMGILSGPGNIFNGFNSLSDSLRAVAFSEFGSFRLVDDVRTPPVLGSMTFFDSNGGKLELFSDGHYAFTAAIMADGTAARASFTYMIADESGATDTATLAFAPPPVSGTAMEDAAALQFNLNDYVPAGGAFAFSLDAPTYHLYDASGAEISANLIDKTDLLTLSDTGILSWNGEAAGADRLAAGMVLKVTGQFTAMNASGERITDTYAFKMIGVDDSLVTFDRAIAVDEDDAFRQHNVSSSFFDPDLFAAVGVQDRTVSHQLFNAAGEAIEIPEVIYNSIGEVLAFPQEDMARYVQFDRFNAFAFRSGSPNVDWLAAGDYLVTTVDYHLASGGSQGTVRTTITTHGINDDPRISVEGGDSVSLREDEAREGRINLADIDHDDTPRIFEINFTGRTQNAIDAGTVAIGDGGTTFALDANGTILVTMSSGGLFTVNAQDADWLLDGEIFASSLWVTALDESGAVSNPELGPTEIRIMVAGTSDAPPALVATSGLLGEMYQGFVQDFSLRSLISGADGLDVQIMPGAVSYQVYDADNNLVELPPDSELARNLPLMVNAAGELVTLDTYTAYRLGGGWHVAVVLEYAASYGDWQGAGQALFNVTGTNERPDVNSILDDGRGIVVKEGEARSFDLHNYTFDDFGDTHTFSLSYVNYLLSNGKQFIEMPRSIDTTDLVTLDEHGVLHLNADSEGIGYLGAVGKHINVVGEFIVTDQHGMETNRQFGFRIDGVVDPPTATDDHIAGVVNGTFRGNVSQLLANDFDPNGGQVHFAGIAGESFTLESLNDASRTGYGSRTVVQEIAGVRTTITVSGDGTLTMQLVDDYYGTPASGAVINYRITDDDGDSASAHIFLTANNGGYV